MARLKRWIFAGIGVAFEVQEWLAEAQETARQDAGLRPYLGVSYVKATMEIGKPATTDGTHGIFAHGVIRYRSKYIPAGIEETAFCYEFDRASGQMVICRR